MLQCKFFSGETSSEEERMLKDTVIEGSEENIYFGALNKAKKEHFDLDFDAFLEKAEAQNVSQTKIQPSFLKFYWMAAAFTLLFGSYFILQQNNDAQTNLNTVPVVAAVASKPEVPETTPRNSETKVATNYMPKDFPLTSKKQVIKKTARVRLAENTSKPNKNEVLENPSEPEYNPNYVVVNGRAITNEEEALNYTKEAFTFFAKNMTHTLETANIENLSE